MREVMPWSCPEDIQLLFPEIEGNYELPENIVKYLEDKENSQKEK